MDILNRTFGLEVEMCNVEKAKVKLPAGYSWSADEKIFNTDAQLSSKFGGEVNTPPLTLCQKDREVLRGLYADLVDNGGKMKWSLDLHVHIFAGDLDLEQLKRVFIFSYHCYPFIREYCHISTLDELAFNSALSPLPQHYEAVRDAKTFDEVEKVFINESDKGYLRTVINIASYFKRKTIEFRCFSGADNFELVENCVIATYRMFWFALTHTEEEMKSIATYEEFKDKVKLRRETPFSPAPLIYQGSPKNGKDYFRTSPVKFSRHQFSILKNLHLKEICLVGNLNISTALSVYKKIHLKVYTKNYFTNFLRLIVQEGFVPHYLGELSFIERFSSEEVVRQVAIALVLYNSRKLFVQQTKKNDLFLGELRECFEEALSNAQSRAEGIVDMFQTVEFVYGSLDDALTSEKSILYQFGEEKGDLPFSRYLSKNSNVPTPQKYDSVDFYNLRERIPDDCFFCMFSRSPFLTNFEKIALIKGVQADIYFYATQKYSKTLSLIKNQNHVSPDVKIPPSDLKIVDVESLKIVEVGILDLFSLQKRFIKKVSGVSKASFCYLVMYEEYVLGGFGFDLPRNGNFDLWQLTDFCTNNDVPRLSKLILLCLKTKEVQKSLSRKMTRFVENAVTFVYTKSPVSMKYRSEYRKDKVLSREGRLVYETALGVYTKEEVIAKYNDLIERKNG